VHRHAFSRVIGKAVDLLALGLLSGSISRSIGGLSLLSGLHLRLNE
jgi:hypothetical protein